jgi:hypothetical protein
MSAPLFASPNARDVMSLPVDAVEKRRCFLQVGQFSFVSLNSKIVVTRPFAQAGSDIAI